MPPRYTDQPLPPYAHTPGVTPHPRSDPRGHSFGLEEPATPPLDPDDWRASDAYLEGIDLFNHGYFWEAHEAWERLWIAAGRRGEVAAFLQGLIKLAAAGVKHREGRLDGVRRHARRAAALFASLDAETYAGLDLGGLLKTAELVEKEGGPPGQIEPR